MSDQQIAGIGRKLEEVLHAFAYSRDPEIKKELARLHTELCEAVRSEREESVAAVNE